MGSGELRFYPSLKRSLRLGEGVCGKSPPLKFVRDSEGPHGAILRQAWDYRGTPEREAVMSSEGNLAAVRTSGCLVLDQAVSFYPETSERFRPKLRILCVSKLFFFLKRETE